jgi:hypothetical protein
MEKLKTAALYTFSEKSRYAGTGLVVINYSFFKKKYKTILLGAGDNSNLTLTQDEVSQQLANGFLYFVSDVPNRMMRELRKAWEYNRKKKKIVVLMLTDQKNDVSSLNESTPKIP